MARFNLIMGLNTTGIHIQLVGSVACGELRCMLREFKYTRTALFKLLKLEVPLIKTHQN